MKNKCAWSIGIGLVGLGLSAGAWPIGASNEGRDYLISEQGLYRWSGGIYGCEFDRKAKLKPSAFPVTLTSRKWMGYVGYDLTSALTLYVTAGSQELEPHGRWWSDVDPEWEFGGGCRLHLLDHEIPDPTLFENRIRLTAGGQYTMTKGGPKGQAWEWADVLGDVTLRVINDLEANVLFLPNSIGVYASLLYTTLVSDDLRSHHDSDVGFGVGFEVYYTECVSFDVGILRIEGTGYVAGLHVRF